MTTSEPAAQGRVRQGRMTHPRVDPSVDQPRRCDGQFVERNSRDWVHRQLSVLDEPWVRVWLPEIAHSPGCGHSVALTWPGSWQSEAGRPRSTWTVESRFGSRRPTVSVGRLSKRS
jgi:hypothetical protein